ncbi:golgin subfamily A member 7 isoform X1 [Scophthalmus maximus]|uniref:golgin subfamily A member 7 isoform X1 n=1 Tax=Scophthalmus maximus TaxID=52904 RepID=UPI0015E0D206|nr:golgin subfamily A member 7 isoform X1 [Scophthalmus maximus]XP_035495455.1 golgin subfamily A member 7 isoform X1 [Scophthalmus maximus]
MAETHSLQDMRQQAAVAAKVFIQRDYTNGTVCQFQTKFPSELETRLDKQQFEETVRTLNNLYAEAEKLGSQSYIEGCLACLTAYTVFLCMETHYEKVLKKITKYIQEQNDKIYAPRGLLLTDPIERGLRVVSCTSVSVLAGIYSFLSSLSHVSTGTWILSQTLSSCVDRGHHLRRQKPD